MKKQIDKKDNHQARVEYRLECRDNILGALPVREREYASREAASVYAIDGAIAIKRKINTAMIIPFFPMAILIRWMRDTSDIPGL